MASPTVGLKVPKTAERPDRPATVSTAEWAVRAEALGYDSIWLSESWGGDALVELATAAAPTETVRLCTAIVNVYSRTPAVLAMAAATLARISGGRAVLGVGTSHAGTVEGIHSMEYDRPVRRCHETIELVKAFTGDGEVDYAGEVFEVTGVPGLDAAVPVYNAALGPANRRATGRVADGWLPFLLPVSRLGALFEPVAAAARDAGRDPEAIAVTPQVLAAVDDDAAAAEAEVRRFVARYVGGLANYRNALAEWFPDVTAAIGAAWEAGDREAAEAAVTDEMVHELGIAGPPEAARDRLRSLVDSPDVDCPIVYVPSAAPEDLRDRTIEALAPGRL